MQKTCIGLEVLLRARFPSLSLGAGTPQIGWNRVTSTSPIVADGVYYFVNSYAATSTPHEIARADYGGPFTAAVQNGRVFGVQFHPEKSSSAGLQVLRNFIAWT